MENFEEKEEFKIVDKIALESTCVCTYCHKILNVAPIYCVQNKKEIDYVCGRCEHTLFDIDIDVAYRQYVFENFAECLTYPCSNKQFGCNVILRWKEVLDHEKMCEFQCINCPLFYETLHPDKHCTWIGNVKKLEEHVESNHKDCLLTPPQFDITDTKKNYIFFTYVGSQLITVVIKYQNGSKYFCLLMINGTDIESQCYRYQLELFDESRENSIILRKTRLGPLGYMLDNLKNDKSILEVDLIKIKEMLKNTRSVFAKFGIVKKNKKEIMQITGTKNHEILNGLTNSKDKLPTPDEIMLQELECPVCNEFMVPPVYICEAGHSICSDCKPKILNCPNCRGQFSGARNFTLEKLTTRVYYPCRNREIGCSFVTTSEKIRNHEISCELSENQCIVNCGWAGLRPSLYNHLVDCHSEMLLQNNSIQIRDIKDKMGVCNIVYAFGELFRFSIRSGAYKFSLQHIGMIEGDPKFRYQLQIIDQSPLALNFSLTSPCQHVPEDPEAADPTPINIPWDMLKPFIFESRYFYYKIVISKI